MNQIAFWWSPGQIRFSSEQCRWLINVLPLLHEGFWPPKPGGSSPAGPPQGKKRPGEHAPFETPEMAAAEIETRLEACGLDGLLAEAVFGWGKDFWSLMKYFGLDQKELRERVSRCLRYITGWKRKRTPYRNFCNHRPRETKANAAALTPGARNIPWSERR